MAVAINGAERAVNPRLFPSERGGLPLGRHSGTWTKPGSTWSQPGTPPRSRPPCSKPPHEHYLSDPEHARTSREPLADAWAWATQQRQLATTLLHRATGDRIEAFDYLVDVTQRHAAPGSHVPEPVICAAIQAASPADADSLAETAYAQGRYPVAEHAWRQACQANTSNPQLGPEHPDTLTIRGNLAFVLRVQGRLEEAEAEHRATLDVCIRVLGPEHPDTLASLHNLVAVWRHPRYPAAPEQGPH